MNELTLQNIVNFIKENPLCVLSTVSPENKANSASMYIFSDEMLNVYFATKKDTRKVQNLMNNPSVSLVIHKEATLVTLQMVGEAIAIDPALDGQKAYELLEPFRDKISNYVAPISAVDRGDYIIFKVSIDHALLTEYSQEAPNEGVTRQEFTR